jgi:hypothetical protein
MFKYAVMIISLCALLAITGCGKAPEQEMQSAEAAFDQADQAETETYASDAYQMAMDTLNAAKAAKEGADSKFALFRSYGKSRELFVRAEALIKEAEISAHGEKEMVMGEVSGMMTDVKAALDQASDALNRAPRGKGSKADIELIKNDLHAANVAYEEAKMDFEAGRYMAAKTKLQAIKNKAQSISDEIAKAAAKKARR